MRPNKRGKKNACGCKRGTKYLRSGRKKAIKIPSR